MFMAHSRRSQPINIDDYYIVIFFSRPFNRNEALFIELRVNYSAAVAVEKEEEGGELYLHPFLLIYLYFTTFT